MKRCAVKAFAIILRAQGTLARFKEQSVIKDPYKHVLHTSDVHYP